MGDPTGARVIYLGLPDCFDCIWHTASICHAKLVIPARTDASSCDLFRRQRPFASAAQLELDVIDGNTR